MAKREDSLDPSRPIPENKGGAAVTFETANPALIVPEFCVCCLGPAEAELERVVKIKRVNWNKTLVSTLLVSLVLGQAHPHVVAPVERTEFSFPVCERCLAHHRNRIAWVVGLILFVPTIVPAIAYSFLRLTDSLRHDAVFLGGLPAIALAFAATAIPAAVIGKLIQRELAPCGRRCVGRDAVRVMKVGEKYRIVMKNHSWGERFGELNWRQSQ